MGDATYYDDDALVVARTAPGSSSTASRPATCGPTRWRSTEAGLFEQIVLPLLKQRNPDAKRRATQTVVELMRLGDDMRRVLLARELRDHLPPPWTDGPGSASPTSPGARCGHRNAPSEE